MTLYTIIIINTNKSIRNLKKFKVGAKNIRGERERVQTKIKSMVWYGRLL